MLDSLEVGQEWYVVHDECSGVGQVAVVRDHDPRPRVAVHGVTTL